MEQLYVGDGLFIRHQDGSYSIYRMRKAGKDVEMTFTESEMAKLVGMLPLLINLVNENKQPNA